MPSVHTVAISPPLDPAEVARRLAHAPGLAWLDGGLEHGREGRFSYLSVEPRELLESSLQEPDPLAPLRRIDAVQLRSGARASGALDLESVPRWVGHVSYDAALPERARARRDSAVPAVRFARYDAFYVYDHERGSALIAGDDARACEALRERLAASPALDLAYRAGPIDATPGTQHLAALAEAARLIGEGELYQINLARRFRAPFAGSALGLFLRMRELSPVPFGYYVEAAEHAVLGRSMERYLRYRRADRWLWTSPIKGTLARGGDDAREAEALRTDPKEHAEHAMVVDLMRNDLSRVCEIGSVTIDELMAVLPFAGLSHLVSTVRGVARADVALHDLFTQTFPPGSVTGTPKERVMRAIDELEQTPRGLYTGCYGFVDRAGGCSLSVAIRTAVVERGEVTYFAGGGIVADSVAERELAETELKAELFRRALAAV